MKKIIITLSIIIVLFGTFIGVGLIINYNRFHHNLKFKNGKGKTIIELGNYKASKYSEYKKTGWKCDFGIDNHDDFLSFIKSSSYYDETLCFDCKNRWDTVDENGNIIKTTYSLHTIGYIAKDGYLFCYEIDEVFARLELVVSPFWSYLSDDYEAINEEPYFVCDKKMYYYGTIDDASVSKPCWNGRISFENILKIYEKVPNMVVDVKEAERSITVYTVDKKTYEINKNQKIKMTFDENSFINYQIVE